MASPPRLTVGAARTNRVATRPRGPAPRALTCACAQGTLLPLLEQEYDCFFLDQFGVLHDGKDPYPLARDLCRKLAAQKKRLVVLSNSSRLSTSTFDRLESMGYDRSWFAGCVTSGDVARAVLTTREGDDTAILRADGRMWSDVHLGSDEPLRCLHLTWSQRGAKDGFKTKQTIDLGETPRVEVANDPESADAVLIHGTEAVTRTDESGVAEVHPAGEGEVEDLLRGAAARNLPMLVANPDLVTVSGEELVAMPGSLARKYVEDFGAPRERVHLLGKPSPIIYTLACEKFGIPKGERMVAVGDSLEHDIKGARQFGIDSVFISAGIHGRQLHGPDGLGDLDAEALRSLCFEALGEGSMPTIVSKHFE